MLIEPGQFWKDRYFKEIRIVQVVAIRNEFIRIKTLVRIPGKSLSAGYATWISWNRFLDNYILL